MHNRKSARFKKRWMIIPALICAISLICYYAFCHLPLTQKEHRSGLSNDMSSTIAASATFSMTDLYHIKALSLLSNMTLEEKVGQLFIARCPTENAAQKAADYHIGGYILFERDFQGKSQSQIIAEIESYQNAAAIPLFIGVDEEGGSVNRISTNPQLRATPFLSPQALYAQGGFALIRSDTQEKCELLKSLGINLNFAPVCDLSQNPTDFIYDRSFGQDSAMTAEYVRTLVTLMNQYQMGSVLKHFPGYGNMLTHIPVSPMICALMRHLSLLISFPFKQGLKAARRLCSSLTTSLPAWMTAPPLPSHCLSMRFYATNLAIRDSSSRMISPWKACVSYIRRKPSASVLSRQATICFAAPILNSKSLM